RRASARSHSGGGGDRPGTVLLAAGLTVDELAQDVGVAGVAGGLLQQVHEHPAQVDGRLVAGVAARLLEVGGRGHDGVHASPSVPVDLDRTGQRVVRVDGVVRDLDVLTGEAVQDP